METNYFKFRGFDYIPLYGAMRSSKRLEETREQNPNVKVSLDDFSVYASGQLLGMIGGAMALKGLISLLN